MHVAALQRQVSSLRAELDRLRAEQQSLVAPAYQDSLTGLGNRHSFMMHMDREWALTQRDGVDCYVLVADLDRFKSLNDTYGHAASAGHASLLASMSPGKALDRADLAMLAKKRSARVLG
jgi:PleD family two-component response regulator